MSYFSDDQAVDIWKAKWLGETVQSLVGRYKENPFRFYEVWEEERNPGARERAWSEFQTEHPAVAATTVPEPHVPKRKVVTKLTHIDDAQLSLL